jgi:hypothetical protein
VGEAEGLHLVPAQDGGPGLLLEHAVQLLGLFRGQLALRPQPLELPQAPAPDRQPLRLLLGLPLPLLVLPPLVLLLSLPDLLLAVLRDVFVVNLLLDLLAGVDAGPEPPSEEQLGLVLPIVQRVGVRGRVVPHLPREVELKLLRRLDHLLLLGLGPQVLELDAVQLLGADVVPPRRRVPLRCAAAPLRLPLAAPHPLARKNLIPLPVDGFKLAHFFLGSLVALLEGDLCPLFLR